ncbi:MAG: tripartite tricarboxylate transporter permease, partial [Candidatus Thermoplasmatota archaeon]|nr:tripartite tricarboxylate transporter permease [Candidatus Thermoplasmatota archaeon]
VNNIALIFLSLTTTILAVLHPLINYGITADFILVLIALYIISVSISHTFHDTIPSTFLGAPDEDTALSVLPAHTLLLEGKGYEAVAISAMGSFGAILFCFVLLLPVRFIIGAPLHLYSVLQDIMLYILLAITILMIATEKGKIDDITDKGIFPSVVGMLFATFLFILSGIFGIIALDLPVQSPIGFDSPVLFPALSGLFGLPTLITSLATKPKIPKQHLDAPRLSPSEKRASLLSITTGSTAGILVSIIPGITSAVGTILAMNVRGESDKRQTIVTLSAVNTACAFFVVVVLYIILRSRSGATLAVMQLISIQVWDQLLMPVNLIYLLIALLFGGTLSYFLTLKVGKLFAKSFSQVPYQPLVTATISLILILVFLFTGFTGLFILLVATFIGLIPVQWGVRRSHCMGILLVPIILYFL